MSAPIWSNPSSLPSSFALSVFIASADLSIPSAQVAKKKTGSDAGSDAEGSGRKRKRRIMSDSEASDAGAGDDKPSGEGEEEEGEKEVRGGGEVVVGVRGREGRW